MLRLLGFCGAACLATAACSGEVSSDSATPSPAATASSSAGGAPTVKDGVTDSIGMNELAHLDGLATSMTADDSTLYVGMQDGRVLSVAQSGGDPAQLLAVDAESYPEGIAVDDAFLYVSSLSQRNVVRLLKTGGALQVLAEDLNRPYQLALDDTHVYVADQGSILAGGSANDGKVLSVVKDGSKPAVTLADAQQATSAIGLDANNVYFANGPFGDVNGSIRAVPKTGGDVQVLARQLATVNNFVLADDRAWFVDAQSKLLSFVLLAGGEATPTGGEALSPFGLTSDGTSFFGTTLDPDTNHAALRRLDATGKVTATLAEWTYAQAVTPIGSLATITTPSRVYWVDLESSPDFGVRSTIRWSTRP